MLRIAFIGNGTSPDKLLELFRKMTPNKMGQWGKLIGVHRYDIADCYAVIDKIPKDLIGIIPQEKCIFLGAHPKSISHAYVNMDNLKCFAKYDCEKSFGLGEWWIKYDYDFLCSLQPIKKSKTLCSIVSDVDYYHNHKMRKMWLQRFCDTNPADYNLYGRIQPFTDKMKKYYHGELGQKTNHMGGKELVLNEHKYIVEFDNDSEGHYFSERIFDDLLLWTLPIYWGGQNLHKYIPKESFRYLNINGNGEDVYNILKEDIYEKSISAIAEARDILLNKLQIWPRVHEAIYGTTK